MELAEWNTVYGLRGNCDNLVSEFVAARGEEERFYRHYVDVWRDRCLLVQMGHAAGFETRGPEELPALREVVRARFGPELAFLEAMPEILLTPDSLFVPGGVADEAHLEGLDGWTTEGIHDALIALAEKLVVKNATLMWPVRIAAAGKTVTPGGAVEICHVLGREETLRRLRLGLDKLR